MILFENKKNCSGCTTCSLICPQKAIDMQPDKLGFLYPEINEMLCINCNLCKEKCAFQSGYDYSDNFSEPLAFAVRHKDLHQIETSRSGAMFIAVSDYVLEAGGIVYGVGYNDGFHVCHKRAETKKKRDEFKGSKYVQSDLQGIFYLIKEDLQNGLQVLFSGTPCQTAGLAAFLNKMDKSNLFLIDLVCHGVPSPYVWKDYLAYIENKHKQKVIKVDFRDKSLGWNSHKESFVFSDHKKIIKDTFSQLFSQCILFRPSCGNCKYTNLNRPSDITIADFWGWEKTDINFNDDNKGCSLAFLNTKKGQSMWKKIDQQLNYIPARLENCLQPNLICPSKLHKHSQSFYEDYQKKGFLYVAKRYGNLGWRYKMRTIKNKIFS